MVQGKGWGKEEYSEEGCVCANVESGKKERHGRERDALKGEVRSVRGCLWLNTAE